MKRFLPQPSTPPSQPYHKFSSALSHLMVGPKEEEKKNSSDGPTKP
ncbi:uncharacterized protein CTRU02_211096 [Colletotrichum truncatum]|uniref:Uncharacterized protein n=1 Tax=Colletotrichum truncatum TaxID=5467 RepID=A0ACC3YR21_COLTU|nr:uncharacterized protein CTRU02_01875 [Colletotrichum truncatum]KAF6799004.1 hypothetical protein CTRU02_01875 [Colletotrichum truncatum]